ncbi:MAG: VWA domain-containing protein [Hominilimicola sp.]
MNYGKKNEFIALVISQTQPVGFSDNVLKSTRLEREMFREMYNKTPELAELEKLGRQTLPTFKQLINDVFQAFYAIAPKMLDDEALSQTARRINKSIIANLLTQKEYAERKAVCEGCELPAMEAAIVFIREITPRLAQIVKEISGGSDRIGVLENMTYQCGELCDKLKQELKKPSPDEKAAIKLANKLKSKNEQLVYLEKMADRAVNTQKKKINADVSSALAKAVERAEGVKYVLVSWGNNDGNMTKTEFNTGLLDRVSKSEKLTYVAKFLGKYKELYSAHHKNGYVYGRGEKYDITTGSNISKALTSEMSMLSEPELIPVFMRKYQNKKLKQYRRRESISKGKGDIIVCLDESSSTYGENQAWGMAIAMTLLQICRDNKRDFALIHFSGDTKTDLFLKDDKDIRERMLKASETFLSGGTNFEKPLNEAIGIIESGNLKKADIVFITDGACNISEEFEKSFKETQSRHKFTVTGILLDEGLNFDFSLKKFCKKIYRTSELCKDDIAADIINNKD